MSISTEPDGRKIAALVNAASTGDYRTANHLMAELVTGAEDMFLMLMSLAQHAAWPAIAARVQLAEDHGRRVQEIIPRAANTPEQVQVAMQLVAHFANGEERKAIDLAGEVTRRVAEMDTDGHPFPHKVVVALAEICANPPSLTPIEAKYADQARNAWAN